ncbi:MAG: HAD-IB family phosphatase [Lachnospiraceae bacterium]|nr:HAD-IB family phosphatase [Lachnospiraceae bacterium]
MNVYDFDGTIYKNDSTRDFYYYLLRHYTKVIKYLPKFVLDVIKYKLDVVTKTKMKETFYRFLNSFEDGEIDRIVLEFWDKHRHKIYDWYYKQKEDTDVIISASPRYILEPICKELNVKLICSEVNVKNGDYIGVNCYGEEKVNRFYKEFPNGVIDKFYSDSNSDLPLAKLAKEAYKVTCSGKIKKWNI